MKLQLLKNEADNTYEVCAVQSTLSLPSNAIVSIHIDQCEDDDAALDLGNTLLQFMQQMLFWSGHT